MAGAKCPICSRRADPRHAWYPFCSKRCRTQDLANWASGRYAVAAPVSEADESLEPLPAPDESGWDA